MYLLVHDICMCSLSILKTDVLIFLFPPELFFSFFFLILFLALYNYNTMFIFLLWYLFCLVFWTMTIFLRIKMLMWETRITSPFIDEHRRPAQEAKPSKNNWQDSLRKAVDPTKVNLPLCKTSCTKHCNRYWATELFYYY